MVHAGGAHNGSAAAGVRERDAVGLYLRGKAFVAFDLFGRPLDIGIIGLLNMVYVILDIQHGLDVGQRYKRAVHVNMLIGVVIARQNFTQLVRGDLLAVHQDGPVFHRVAVLIQKAVLLHHVVIRLRIVRAAGDTLQRIQDFFIAFGRVLRDRRQRAHGYGGKQHQSRQNYGKEPFACVMHKLPLLILPNRKRWL